MAKDYKDRIPAYRRRKRSPAQRWMVVGGAVTGVIGVLVLAIRLFSGSDVTENGTPGDTVTLPAPPPHTSAPAKPADTGKPTAQTPAPKDQPTPSAQEPRFSFYKILPEKEVIIPESEIKTLKREESLGQKPQTATYMVQAGSFTKQPDAERLKAQLALVKVKAKLEMIKLDNTTWFRVKIGPYASLADADKVRQYLRANNIDSVVQKVTP